MRRFAFTLIELIFVIVIIGVLSKFGVEFLAQMYNSFIFSTINNALHSKSEIALQSIASRLQYRIKDSVIAKKPNGEFKALESSDYAKDATILEWIGSDIDGYRGDELPIWSGVIDLELSNKDLLISPQTDTTAIEALIRMLSGGGSGVSDAALYFVGSNSDIQTGYGWGGAITTQNATMHPIRAASLANQFVPINGVTGADNDFFDVDVYEYYQLAWSAYAVVYTPDDENLTLYYDYQPWQAESYESGKKAVIMQNVDTFEFKAIGSIIKIKVCVNTDIVEDYSLCKEKTIY